MATDNVGAYQEMCARIRDVINSADVAAIVGYTPELRYGDVNYPKLPAPDKLWCKFSMAEAAEKARTLGRQCRITYAGIAGIQLFVPETDKQAAERIRRLAERLKSAFALSTANVDFYKAGIKDLPPDPPWIYKRVSATYQYAEYQGIPNG